MTSLSTFRRLNEVFEASMEIPFDSSSKIVLISDCHRGNGNWADDFSHNQNLYYCAIKYYYENGFTYIDLGDSDELWKNNSFSDICNVYSDIFRLLHKFYAEHRLYMIFGNHDMVKKYPYFVKQNMERFYNRRTDRYESLFPGIQMHEGLILKNTETNKKLFLVHGHQGDIISDIFWKAGRFLSRHIWKILEFFGVKNPISAAVNLVKKKKVEKKIFEWIEATGQPVIAGHTHRPACPVKGNIPYFNTGSCIHPNCITCIEIVNSIISLVEWNVETREDRTVFVNRELLAEPREL